jgi:hypothetical protein
VALVAGLLEWNYGMMGFLVPVQISLSALPKPPVSMAWPPFEAPPSRPGLQPSNHAQYMPVPCLLSSHPPTYNSSQPRFSRAHVGAYSPLVLEKCVLDNHTTCNFDRLLVSKSGQNLHMTFQSLVLKRKTNMTFQCTVQTFTNMQISFFETPAKALPNLIN